MFWNPDSCNDSMIAITHSWYALFSIDKITGWVFLKLWLMPFITSLIEDIENSWFLITNIPESNKMIFWSTLEIEDEKAEVVGRSKFKYWLF